MDSLSSIVVVVNLTFDEYLFLVDIYFWYISIIKDITMIVCMEKNVTELTGNSYIDGLFKSHCKVLAITLIFDF